MNNLVEADILATCNALGTEVTGVYEKGVECLECLRDLLRYLRKDDDNHSVLRFLGSIRLVQTDLLPLLKRYEHDDDIFDFVLRLLVALSSPALLLFKEEIPEDKLSQNVYLQLVSHLQTYKEAFTDVDAWKALAKRLHKLLETRSIERSENESLVIERILIFIRNILHIPSDDKILNKTDHDLSPNDRILLRLRKSKLDASILYFCANEEEHQFSLHVLEIVTLMLREHSAETLATCNEQRSAVEKEEDINSLVSALQREKSVKVKKVQSMVSSRFSGVYCVKNMKSLSDNDYISHKFITNIDDVKFDVNKSAKRKPKNRLPAKDVDYTRQSTLTVRLFLKNFCKEFLKTYNKLMATVKRELVRKSSDDHDDSYYLWAIEYFMRFNRSYKFQPDFVSETISVQIFHHIQTQITNYLEMMMTDKKKANCWSKRMQLGVSAYKELLKTLQIMTKSTDLNIQHNADIVISNIFYVIEYREMLLSLLTHYDEIKFPLTYLAELVESAYLFLKMLEDHSKRNSEIIIQKKKRKVRRRKKKPKAPEQENEVQSLDEKWIDIASELSAAVQGRRNIPEDVIPFDATSEVDFGEQKVETVYKIRNALLSKETTKAVGFLRAARDLWPDGDSFGSPDIESEDEFFVLREIFLSDLNNPQIDVNTPAQDPDSLEETDEELESVPALTEQKLDLNEIYNRYATHKVVIPCCSLFNNYQKNSRQTNSCLIKFLHRIAWNCKMHALFFQATLFITFQRIFQDSDALHDIIIKEFYRFGKYIMSKFFDVADKNKKMFVEMLFWKGAREAYELEEGYGTSENRAVKLAWTEDEEEELKYLYDENKDIYIEGQDVADVILANLNKRRSKQQIISALKRLGLIQSVKDLKPQLRKEWQEAEITDLQNLFEDHKNSNDIMSHIMDGLSIKRSRKAIVEKLLELNLIHDRKEVLKKRSKKSTNKSDNEYESDDMDDDIVENAEWPRKDKFNRVESSDEDAETNFFNQLHAERRSNLGNFSTISENYDNRESNFSENNQEQIDLENKVLKRKKSNKLWDESEIIELHRMFSENKEDGDVLRVILNSLTIKRSKESVIEKLLEIGLIKDRKEIRKKKAKLHNSNLKDLSERLLSKIDDQSVSLTPSASNSRLEDKNRKKKARQILSDDSENETVSKNRIAQNDAEIELDITNVRQCDKKENNKKRPAKLWDEQEIIELKKLFEESKSNSDIVGNIMLKQTIKRSKPLIIEKLLELQLIKDRKEVRKKRQRKTQANGKRTKSDTDSSDEDIPLALSLGIEKHKKNETGMSLQSAEKNIASKASNKIIQKNNIKIWEEQEIIELHQLFQDNQDVPDILSTIISKMTIKRTKKSITEKLLEVGLIKGTKELKKRDENRLKENKKPVFIDKIQVTDIQKASSNAVKLKNGKVLLYSSDDEQLPISSLIFETGSAQNTSGISDEVSDSTSRVSHILNDVSDNLSTANHSIAPESEKIISDTDSLSLIRKRKRIRIDESDDSDNESKNTVTRDGKIFGHDTNISDSEISSLQNVPVSSKKRIRILIDSEDSD